MERYQLQFLILLASFGIILIILLLSINKIKIKAQKRLSVFLALYFFCGLISVGLYAASSFITGWIPAAVSYQSQCMIWALVFCANIVGNVMIVEFINEIFYKRNRIIINIFVYLGAVLFIIFFLGGILGFSHQHVPGIVNNNDVKIEYYLLYNLYYLPIIILALSGVFKLLKNREIEAQYRFMLKSIAGMFFCLGLVFIFGIIDGIDGESYIFAFLSILMIPFACLLAYLGFFNQKESNQ